MAGIVQYISQANSIVYLIASLFVGVKDIG